MSERHLIALWLGLAVVLLVGVVAVTRAIERVSAPRGLISTTMYVPPASVARRLALGYAIVASDVYWLRSIQYFGDRSGEREQYRWLYPLLNLVTDLDPRFGYAYRFAGVAIPYGAESAVQANVILHKGLTHRPDVWQIPFYIGYNHYTYLGDYATAAEYIALASQKRGAPAFLAPLASRLYAEGGKPEMAVEFLARVYASVEDPALKAKIEQRLKLAIVERDIQFLTKGVDLYRERVGRDPDRLEDLVAVGLLRGLPREPFGGRYVYNRATGEVLSTGTRERLRLYRPPSERRGG